MADTAIDMRDISMSFNGVEVLKKINFTLRRGEIMGLIGKNGAGKSTLLKIIEGLYTPVSGQINIFGREIGKNVSAAERAGTVAMIFQDFSLIPDMTVVENIFLNNEPTSAAIIDDKACRRKVEEFFTRYAVKIDPGEKIKNLSTSDMQMVEISKAIIREKKIILMDEPTAALEAEQVEKLFEIIGRLKAEGYSIVLISHHLKEIMRICDSVTVLCDGIASLSKPTPASTRSSWRCSGRRCRRSGATRSHSGVRTPPPSSGPRASPPRTEASPSPSACSRARCWAWSASRARARPNS